MQAGSAQGAVGVRVSGLPDGVVTFLFSDIEGSTRLVKALREQYPQVLAEHRRLVRAAIAAHGGREVDTAGDGFFVAFGGATAGGGVRAGGAARAGRAPSGRPARRSGCGSVCTPGRRCWPGTGTPAWRCIARRGSAPWPGGGQVLISQATQDVVEDEEEEELGFTLVDVGEYRLKGLDRPVRLFRLAAAGAGPGPGG